MRYHSFIALIVLLGMFAPAHAMSPEERRTYRDKLVSILPNVPAFDEWLKKTDELPPDFDALPRCNGLPDPLKFYDGREVKSADDWSARRAEIRQLLEKYAWGTIPPHPKLDGADVTQETQSPGYRTRAVVLHFGPESKGVLHVSLIIPDGKGPFPSLIGPGLIGGFGGNTAGIALRRGYIVASYAGNDSNDDSRALASLYPEFDFATLPRRAWAASMVLDYLQMTPEADMKKIAIFGYSRDGKQAVIAAALDPRIAAVLAGSTGVGGVLPYRVAGERNHGEGIESTSRMFPDWFHSRPRFFAGREDRLPVDGNLLLAMLAPRPCLMISGFNDEVANTWGDEQSLHSAEKVYNLLGAPDRLGVLRLPGFHGSNDMEQGLDFLDFHFGRSQRKWTNQLVFPWDFEQWKSRSGETIDWSKFPERGGLAPVASKEEWEKRASEIRKSVQWMLGEAPPLMPPTAPRFPGGGRPPARPTTGPNAARAPAGNPGQTAPDVINWVIQRGLGGSQEFGWFAADAQKVASREIRFGQNVRGNLYYPADTPEGAKLPVVIWLHSYSYPLGYMWVYHRDLHPILALAKAGYAVLAYDQCGFGSRMNEASAFYDRWPHWSQMGRMVEDARAGIDALQKDSLVDSERVYLFGYSLGANVALHTAALDARVKGVVSICGFTPMRTDTADKGAGGLARYSIDRPLIPRLGLFIGHEKNLPYDYDDLLAAIAPRPVYVLAPQLDRDANPADVKAAVDRARGVYRLYDAADKLKLDDPWDYNRLPTATQDRIIGWMNEQFINHR